MTLQTIHVLAAVIWVGGAAFHIFASARLASAPPEVRGHWAEVGEASGQRYYTPAAIVTLLAGIGMVLVSDLAWSEPFIGIGFGGIIASIVLGAVLVERASKKLVAVTQSETPDPGRMEKLAGQIRLYSIIDFVVLSVVVWAMVTRPGS